MEESGDSGTLAPQIYLEVQEDFLCSLTLFFNGVVANVIFD
jgi:hypothetical protein